METKEKRRMDIGGVLIWAALTAGLVCCGYLAATTARSADDYWYRLFLRYDLRKFVDTVLEHYRTFNGRTLVHLAAAVILRIGNGAFAAVMLASVTAIPALTFRARGGGRRDLPLAAALFTAGFLAMPVNFMVMGVLWISAFCNYLLPTAMICLEIRLFERVSAGENTGAWTRALCVAWAFACGATTEQSGLAATVLMGWFFVKSLHIRKNRGFTALSLLASSAGVLSVFCSPATLDRFRKGAKLGNILDTIGGMYNDLGPAAAEFTASVLVPALFAAVFLLTALRLKRRLHKSWPLYAGAALAAVSLCTFLMGGELLRASFTSMCFLAAAVGIALIALKDETPGILTLLGMGTLAIILLTNEAHDRTLVPTVLYLLAAVSVMAPEELRRLPGALPGAIPATLVLASAIALIPMFRGVTANYAVERQNNAVAAAARETGVMRYCVDYDYRYTYSKINTTFDERYLEYWGLDASTPIEFYTNGAVRKNLFAHGRYLYPTLCNGNGDTLIHVRIIEDFGGSVENVGKTFTELMLTLGDTVCHMTTDGDGMSTFTWTDGNGAVRTRVYPRVADESRTWFPMELYEDAFGLTFTYDGKLPGWIVAWPGERE